MYRVEMNRAEVSHSHSIRWAVIVAADLLLIALCSKKQAILPETAVDVEESYSLSPTVGTPHNFPTAELVGAESGGQPPSQQDQAAPRSRSPVLTPPRNLSFGTDETSNFHHRAGNHHHHRLRQPRHDHDYHHQATSGSSNHSSIPVIDCQPLERKSTSHSLPGANTSSSTSTGGYPTSPSNSTSTSARRSRLSPTTLSAVPSRPHYLHLPDAPTTSPMGCILSKRNKNHGLEGDIKVTDLHARIDPQPTTLIETSPTVLKYQTPHFRASAKVRFPPVSSSDTWEVGWVQGCSNMDFFITYGDLGM
nr:uncharacterized protein LOC129277427 [Lytechinus pictus]